MAVLDRATQKANIARDITRQTADESITKENVEQRVGRYDR